ncbi:hypothetical protein [Streptomyces sp. NPDC050982]|uniref:hypothetical protein n=1 Tax=Streptomyces sp. NPDC050982 TaxID=3154746 RepID=UPI0033E00BC0
MTKTTRLTSAGAVAAGVLCLATLAACGSSSSGGSDDTAKDDQVASVTSPAAKDGASGASASASPSGTRKGVQLRMDMSDEEKDRIYQGWGACLKSQGVPTGDKGIPGKVYPAAGPDEYPKEFKACEAKHPITPPEMDPDTNPEYEDDFRAWVRCMNDKGLKVNALPDGAGWTYADERGPVDPGSAQADQIEADCLNEAFSAKK